jgi:hypothetical protein
VEGEGDAGASGEAGVFMGSPAWGHGGAWRKARQCCSNSHADCRRNLMEIVDNP